MLNHIAKIISHKEDDAHSLLASLAQLIAGAFHVLLVDRACDDDTSAGA